MDHTFYPASSLLTRDNPLLNVLVIKYPEIFGVFHAKLAVYADQPLTGLFVLKMNDQIVTIAVLLNLSVDRIFTVPRYRNLGHAKTMLCVLCGMATILGVGLVSPAYSELRTLYERAGWKLRTEKPINKDGTLMMVTPLWKPNKLYDAGRWLNYLEAPKSPAVRVTTQ